MPVLGADSGQIPVLIRETGGGLVFPEGNVGVLADQVLCLYNDESERLRLAQAGAKAVTERYTCEAVAQQMYTLLWGTVKTNFASPALDSKSLGAPDKSGATESAGIVP